MFTVDIAQLPDDAAKLKEIIAQLNSEVKY